MNPVEKGAAWRSLAFLLAVGVAIWNLSAAAGADANFEGEKSTWHDGFARFDYLMDDETLDVQPFKRSADERYGIKDPPPGKHRCVVIVPKQPALGNPWSWRGCYWDHQPQVEVELLKRGFHVAYISANATLKPGKQWEAWYTFLTEKHELSKKPAFIGMSRGGEYSYIWATSHPNKVSCIYADNPGVNPDVLKKLGDLAAADVPILHVCGSIDPLLARSAGTIENIYQQFGGRISVMIKEGRGHHPHSLRDPQPIADFISQSVQPIASTPPAYLSGRIAKSSFYSLENAYRHFPQEGIYITCRGPWFTNCYERYSFELKGVQGAINVILPRKPAPSKPWIFRADQVGRDATVDLALLAKGFHIVTGPVPYNADGPSLQDWNAVYKLLTEQGFSRKPVLEGAGGAAGEAYAWAIANPDKLSCIYGENPVLHCTMTKAQPLDNLAVLARAGVPMLHVCGSLDPMLQNQTRVAESRCKELGAALTVIIQEGIGHYPTAPRDPTPVVDFILRQQEPNQAKIRSTPLITSPPISSTPPITSPPPKSPPPASALPSSTAPPPTDQKAAKALGRSQSGTGQYFQVDYPPSTVEGELRIAVTYTGWIPDGVKHLRGVIVHQHGAGTTASIEGGTAAYDLHWQALAKKWDCALLGPSYHVLHDQNDISPGGSELWFDPRRGSEKAFLKALGDLANVSAHPELVKAPWILWGHSGGGIWADVLCTLHPERVVAMWLRSGSAAQFRTHPEFVRPQVPSACYGIPIMVNPGVKEEKTFKQNPKGLEKGPWWGNLATFHEYREQGALIGLAADPRTGHECGDSRYLAIPYLDACMALRLPAPESQDQKLKTVNTSQAWLAPLFGTEVVPAAKYRGDIKESVWLPNEAVAKAWLEYTRTGAVGDTTPPPAPINMRAWPKGSKGEFGTEVVWNAEADFESGISGFIVLRDGQELAKLPQTPVGRFGRPLFQSMTYHDTPAQPLPEMRYLDISARPGAPHTYEVISVNSVGLKSAPSVKAVPYPRINMSTSYQVDATWPRRPQNVSWGPMSGVAVDAQDNVWVLSRTDPPVQIYRPEGTFLRAWGEGLLDTPHQLKLDRQGNVWLADSGNHVVLQCTPQGKVIRTLGTRREPGCDERHFNRPADMVVTPEGDVFVADGYGNARVVHFDRNGTFVKSWGKLGTEPGDFSLPHAIALDSRGRLYVADRNNVRIQVFDQNGNFLDQWPNIVVPCAFWMTRDDELWVCGSSPMTWRADDKVLGYPPVDQLFMRFNSSGKLLQLWAAPKGEDGKERPGDLNWAHGMALDSKGNIYAVDIKGKRAQKFLLQKTSATLGKYFPSTDLGGRK
jgi:pimeloyl-ACP methyl ester carboxylesterase